MNKVLMACVALTLLGVAYGNFAVAHSAILDKFHPVVKRFSVSLADELQDSNLQTVVYEAITATLATKVDDYVAQTNGTNLKMCCSCKTCTRKCKACGKSCCCKGSGGCRCSSCSSSAANIMTQDVSSPDDVTMYRQVWSDDTKMTLVQELTAAVATHSDHANLNMCCSCKKCTRRCSACGKSCCCSGSGGCHCRSCSNPTGTMTWQMSAVSDLVAVTPQAETAIHKVNNLMDELTTLMELF